MPSFPVEVIQNLAQADEIIAFAQSEITELERDIVVLNYSLGTAESDVQKKQSQKTELESELVALNQNLTSGAITLPSKIQELTNKKVRVENRLEEINLPDAKDSVVLYLRRKALIAKATVSKQEMETLLAEATARKGALGG